MDEKLATVSEPAGQAPAADVSQNGYDAGGRPSLAVIPPDRDTGDESDAKITIKHGYRIEQARLELGGDYADAWLDIRLRVPYKTIRKLQSDETMGEAFQSIIIDHNLTAFEDGRSLRRDSEPRFMADDIGELEFTQVIAMAKATGEALNKASQPGKR